MREGRGAMRDGRGAMRREECTRGPAFSSLVRLALHFSKENERRSAYAAFRARSLVLERGRPPGARSLARPRRHGIALGRLGGALVRMGRRVRVAAERGFDERLFLAPRRVRGAPLGRARGPHERAEPRAARGKGRADARAEGAHRGEPRGRPRAKEAPSRGRGASARRRPGRVAPAGRDAGFSRAPARARDAPDRPRDAPRDAASAPRARGGPRVARRTPRHPSASSVGARSHRGGLAPRGGGRHSCVVVPPLPASRSGAETPRRRPRRRVRRRRARRPARTRDGRVDPPTSMAPRADGRRGPRAPDGASPPRTPRRLRDSAFRPLVASRRRERPRDALEVRETVLGDQEPPDGLRGDVQARVLLQPLRRRRGRGNERRPQAEREARGVHAKSGVLPRRVRRVGGEDPRPGLRGGADRRDEREERRRDRPPRDRGDSHPRARPRPRRRRERGPTRSVTRPRGVLGRRRRRRRRRLARRVRLPRRRGPRRGGRGGAARKLRGRTRARPPPRVPRPRRAPRGRLLAPPKRREALAGDPRRAQEARPRRRGRRAPGGRGRERRRARRRSRLISFVANVHRVSRDRARRRASSRFRSRGRGERGGAVRGNRPERRPSPGRRRRLPRRDGGARVPHQARRVGGRRGAGARGREVQDATRERQDASSGRYKLVERSVERSRREPPGAAFSGRSDSPGRVDGSGVTPPPRRRVPRRRHARSRVVGFVRRRAFGIAPRVPRRDLHSARAASPARVDPPAPLGPRGGERAPRRRGRALRGA